MLVEQEGEHGNRETPVRNMHEPLAREAQAIPE